MTHPKDGWGLDRWWVEEGSNKSLQPTRACQNPALHSSSAFIGGVQLHSSSQLLPLPWVGPSNLKCVLLGVCRPTPPYTYRMHTLLISQIT